MSKKQSNKGFGMVGILLIILVVVGVGFSSWYIWHKHQPQGNLVKTQSQASTTTKTPVADPYSGWKSYSNQKYGFSFRYPTTWKIEESSNNQPSGIDPVEFSVSLEFDTSEKYNGTAEFEIHDNDLAAVAKLQDDIYSQTSLNVNKKELILKGKQAIEYDVTGPTAPSNTYLFGMGNKTYSYGSAIETSAQQQSPTYRSDFAKVYSSLEIK